MIVPMKKARIVVLKEDQEKLFLSLQRYGELMLIASETTITKSDGFSEEQLMQRTDKALKLLKKHEPKKSTTEYRAITYEDFMQYDPQREKKISEIEAIEEAIHQHQATIHEKKQEITRLLPWIELSSPLIFPQFRYTNVFTGVIDPRSQDTFTEIMERYGCDYQLLQRTPEGLAVYFACFIEDKSLVLDEVRLLGFQDVKLPTTHVHVKETIDFIREAIVHEEEAIVRLNERLASYAQDNNDLKLLNDQIASQSALNQAHHQETLQTVYIEGWVRSDRLVRLETAITEATSVYDIDITDPIEGENPPTVTQNNRFVSQFEGITDMFSRPRPYELDPNPVMAPWYWLIFGIMMGDAGYGLFLLIATILILKLVKPKDGLKKMISLFMYSSISTMIWGILFGSYFGATWNPILFSPVDSPIEMLVLVLGLGAAHVITGILAKAYDDFRCKRYDDMVFDRFSWVLIIVGLGMMFLESLATIGTGMAILGAALIAIFGGRKKKGIFGKIIGGFGGLYGVTGYMSDILSYSRILALGLSTGVIGMVMNILAGMVIGVLPPLGFLFALVIYIIGHSFNIAMGLLSTYVHDSRLQYIEFFSKFYEGGGYEFKPLSIKLKHIDIVNEQK